MKNYFSISCLNLIHDLKWKTYPEPETKQLPKLLLASQLWPAPERASLFLVISADHPGRVDCLLGETLLGLNPVYHSNMISEQTQTLNYLSVAAIKHHAQKHSMKERTYLDLLVPEAESIMAREAWQQAAKARS